MEVQLLVQDFDDEVGLTTLPSEAIWASTHCWALAYYKLANSKN